MTSDKSIAEVYLSKWQESSDTYRTMRSALRSLASVLGAPDYNSCAWEMIRYETARAIPARLLDARLAPRTVNKCLSALRGVLATAWHQGRISREDYSQIEIKNVFGRSVPAGRALDDADVNHLSDALSGITTRNAAMIAIIYACGLRRIEVTRLQREDYDPYSLTLHAIGKGGKERFVPIAPDWQSVIEDHWRTLRPGVPMFSSSQNRAISRSGISAVINDFSRRIGGERFTPHDLRRSFITHILERGGDVLVAQRLAGHSNVNTTAIYDRRGHAAEAEAVKVLRRK